MLLCVCALTACGQLWAETNVGASYPEEQGYGYRWGGTVACDNNKMYKFIFPYNEWLWVWRYWVSSLVTIASDGWTAYCLLFYDDRTVFIDDGGFSCAVSCFVCPVAHR